MPSLLTRLPLRAAATSFNIDVLGAAVANTGFSTAFNVAYWNNGATSGSTQNASLTYGLDSPLRAGTYSMTFLIRTASDRGILTIAASVDGVTFTTVGSVDAYNAVNTSPDRLTVTGLVMPQGTRYLSFTVATKNASSTAYNMALQGITGQRTGN